MVIIVWGTLNVYRYLKVNKQNNKGSIMVKIENESNDFVLLISQQIMTLLYNPNVSTVNQLIEIYFNIISNMDRDVRFFFVVSKAFDKVWHKGLLFKF
jgi:hypothetical protein